MTDLQELIDSSGANAEAKGFHDDGNILRWLLNEESDGKEVKILVDGKEWELSEGFLDRIYSAYKGNRLMLIVGELVETHEEIRSGQPSIYEKDGKPEGTAVELADVQIRLGDYASEFEEPVVEALKTKADYNAKRARMHGGRKF